jgi:membrane protein implicated in regulation of membrane protease activity
LREKRGRRLVCPWTTYDFFVAFFTAFFAGALVAAFFTGAAAFFTAAFFVAVFFTAFFVVAIVVILPFYSHYETKREKLHHKS